MAGWENQVSENCVWFFFVCFARFPIDKIDENISSIVRFGIREKPNYNFDVRP